MLNFSNAIFPYYEFPNHIEVILYDKNNNKTKITSDYAISYSNSDLIDEAYTGIRPAPGYTACPDHTEKLKIFKILNAKKNIGASLTESMAMSPSSTVSGYYFSHPNSKYFPVGKIQDDQIEDYAKRKNMTIKEVRKWLLSNI